MIKRELCNHFFWIKGLFSDMLSTNTWVQLDFSLPAQPSQETIWSIKNKGSHIYSNQERRRKRLQMFRASSFIFLTPPHMMLMLFSISGG